MSLDLYVKTTFSSPTGKVQGEKRFPERDISDHFPFYSATNEEYFSGILEIEIQKNKDGSGTYFRAESEFAYGELTTLTCSYINERGRIDLRVWILGTFIKVNNKEIALNPESIGLAISFLGSEDYPIHENILADVRRGVLGLLPDNLFYRSC